MADDESKTNGTATGKPYIDDEYMARYRRDAELGNADAQYHLGLGYLTNLEMDKPDEAEALKWWRKAAEQGHRESMLLLARSYEQG